jgi:subtilisin family serine protease
MNGRPNGVIYFIGLTIVLTVFWVLIPGQAGAAEQAVDGSTVAGPVKSLMSLDGVEAKALTMSSKLDSNLAFLAAAEPAVRNTVAARSGEGALRIKDGQVEVIVLSQEGRRDEATAAVVRAGGTVISLSPGNQRRFKAVLPIESLNSLADEASVSFIKRPQYLAIGPDTTPVSGARRAVAVTTEALDDMNVPIWHEKEGRGQGIKIGVIDAGFQGYTSLKGTELPSQVTVANYVEGEGGAQVDGGGVHGTACAEVIHDVAPLAGLYLAKVDDADDIATAAGWMASQGVRVISTSLGWYTVGPGDGTGLLSEAVTQAKTDGIFWATAGGNERRLHWGGTFNPQSITWGGIYHPTVHIFGDALGFINCFGADGTFPGSCDMIPAGTSLSVYLRWVVDNWDEADTNYDLYLVRWKIELGNPDWEVVKESMDAQNGVYGQNPVESIVNYTTTGQATYYGLWVCQWDSDEPDVNLEVFTPHYDGRLRHYNTPRSISNLADATDAVTVSAVDVNSHAQEEYSSEGPRNGPKGVAGGATAMKPDLAAYSDVSTASFGLGAFPGSSAAAPHVAGAAALVLEAFPRFSIVQARQYLQNRAIDLGAPGQDYLFGKGRLYLGEPPQVVAENLNAIFQLILLSE